MRIDVITIFSRMFEAVFGESIIKRAIKNKRLKVKIWELRNCTHDRHRKVDDRPFGGGGGMVMKPEPFFEAVESIKRKVKSKGKKQKPHIILLSPKGEKLNQRVVKRLAKYKHLILIAGHYEGVDERVVEDLIDEEISIGDYVLTGGELPAMVLIDAITRLLPGVLGNSRSPMEDSFSQNLLEYPQYTRPAQFRGMKVPDVLMSGDHERIAKWRYIQALKITRKKRPDLLKEIKQNG